jgi:peptidoglycan hydrolase-like protein with peptidoglycan-binding domain
VVDQATWVALKDASMQMGDRLLCLHMPNYRGRDAGDLQGALSSMGFACVPDDIFGLETEQALRAFQAGMGLEPTGILDSTSLTALLRLRHIWEGKRGFPIEGHKTTAARSVAVLEAVPVCVFGTDEPTRTLANRIANLARATTTQTRLVSVSALVAGPVKGMLLVGLTQATAAREGVQSRNAAASKAPNAPKAPDADAPDADAAATPCVLLTNTPSFAHELKEAVALACTQANRLHITLSSPTAPSDDLAAKQQQAAVLILDTLCTALG